MLVVTGALGFIGSCLISALNKHRFSHIIAVDDFSQKRKFTNLETKKIYKRIDRSNFTTWLENNTRHVECLFHLGARTDTASQDQVILNTLNLDYTKKLWSICAQNQIPFIYASSAATYGDGSQGYKDSHELSLTLRPLNLYGKSKNDFDKWILSQTERPYFWAGLKFFNVFGPNEYHKGQMASVVFHAYNQIKTTGKLKLFRSHNPDYKDGEQQRDFIYVKDVVAVLLFFMHHRQNSGIYNLGTGVASTFLELAQAIFKALGQKPDLEFIDTPLNIRTAYQYFTQADMKKLRQIYTPAFYSLESGVEDYIKNHLEKNTTF